MAAEIAEGTYKKTFPQDSIVDNLDFSIDSLQLGDSTRSLLSPLYGKGDDSLKEQSFSSSDESSESDANRLEKLVEATYSECSFEDDHSDTVTVKKKEDNGETNSSRSSFSSSNSRTPSRRGSESLHDIEPQLSPWEKWLLSKVIEDHTKAKGKAKKKLLEQEIKENEMAEKNEKEKKAEVNRQQWLQLKNREEKLKKKIKKQEERLKAEQRTLENEKIQELSEESFKNWSELKNIEQTENRKERKLKDCVKRKEEKERKQKSEEAYQKWLEKAKRQPKLTNNHFGYLSGRVTGYYDWTCYPMPAYTNPAPWVGPKIKKQIIGEVKVQSASPPLLFRELEQREGRQKSLKQKNKKNSCK